jgi:vancomycin resistance protein VanW
MRQHCKQYITQHVSGQYLRHNQIWRKKFNADDTCVNDKCITENHAMMMYTPLLPSSSDAYNITEAP